MSVKREQAEEALKEAFLAEDRDAMFFWTGYLLALKE